MNRLSAVPVAALVLAVAACEPPQLLEPIEQSIALQEANGDPSCVMDFPVGPTFTDTYTEDDSIVTITNPGASDANPWGFSLSGGWLFIDNVELRWLELSKIRFARTDGQPFTPNSMWLANAWFKQFDGNYGIWYIRSSKNDEQSMTNIFGNNLIEFSNLGPLFADVTWVELDFPSFRYDASLSIAFFDACSPLPFPQQSLQEILADFQEQLA